MRSSSIRFGLLTALSFGCAGAEFSNDATSHETGGAGGFDSTGGRAELGGGGQVSSGGRAASGGSANASGGAMTAGGGANASGGAASASGGSPATGGAQASSGGVASSNGGTATVGACRELPHGSPSGVYSIDPDGSGSIAPFQASCDMDADGGGWTLILNYVHKAGTNPSLAARKDALPLLGADELGADESSVAANFGHAAPALVLALAPSELRFQGRTSAHPRVIDFVTADKNCIAYFSRGTNNCKGITSSFAPAMSHTATLPAAAIAFMSGKGDTAMTEFPFYAGGVAHWGIRGEGKRWEVDTTPIAGQLGYAADTIHRIWAR